MSGKSAINETEMKSKRREPILETQLLWAIGFTQTQTDLKNAQTALEEAAPEEWAVYERAQAAYEAARAVMARGSELRRAEREMSAIAPRRWRVYQHTQDAFNKAMNANVKASLALKREAPDQYAAVKAIFKGAYEEGRFQEQYDQARQALKAAAKPETWKRYRKTGDRMFNRAMKLHEIEEALRGRAPVEFDLYLEAERLYDQARGSRRAAAEYKRLAEAAETLIVAAYDEWNAYQEALDLYDKPAILEAVNAISRAAPEEWKAYDEARTAVDNALGLNRSNVEFTDI